MFVIIGQDETFDKKKITLLIKIYKSFKVILFIFCFLLFILDILCLFFLNRLQKTLIYNLVHGLVFPQQS